jgi:hypothetical protein
MTINIQNEVTLWFDKKGGTLAAISIDVYTY